MSLIEYADRTRGGLCDGVTAINAEVRTRDVERGIRQQESDGSHKVLGLTHLALGNQRSPLLLEVWVVVKNLLGSAHPGEMQLTRMPAPAHSTAKEAAK
ncbi:short chain dehydrogenase [Colletotrichum scovillei]|uniref:Short chain dehydrogenase n=1 Tax=Colletotrichum scovillei TaxID=1209932 RepID=A0A9P7UIW2_9PEZI|nr:short chain dehydrogenase [Colletotrichum scovillei]KAG7076905.1 short chain dehydrogenase [Colletotrichum scovillei]KAG7083996.1 short chain dehydrogenase [Colletotrichum scovillei]